MMMLSGGDKLGGWGCVVGKVVPWLCGGTRLLERLQSQFCDGGGVSLSHSGWALRQGGRLRQGILILWCCLHCGMRLLVIAVITLTYRAEQCPLQ